jgi:AbrB family looped-hinge helix DNA binding protein
MAKKAKGSPCCAELKDITSCCTVESVVSVDERGQMVLPKDLRAKANIKTGDKFAVVSCQSGGKIYLIALVKTEDLAAPVKGFLGPALKEIIK